MPKLSTVTEPESWQLWQFSLLNEKSTNRHNPLENCTIAQVSIIVMLCFKRFSRNHLKNTCTPENKVRLFLHIMAFQYKLIYVMNLSF